jgi:hypothetical protein
LAIHQASRPLTIYAEGRRIALWGDDVAPSIVWTHPDQIGWSTFFSPACDAVGCTIVAILIVE